MLRTNTLRSLTYHQPLVSIMDKFCVVSYRDGDAYSVSGPSSREQAERDQKMLRQMMPDARHDIVTAETGRQIKREIR